MIEKMITKSERTTIYDEVMNHYHAVPSVGNTISQLAMDKLGRLEDLEERIGMPLEVFVKKMIDECEG